jgi:uncharacterized metal-binding protein
VAAKKDLQDAKKLTDDADYLIYCALNASANTGRITRQAVAQLNKARKSLYAAELAIKRAVPGIW